MRNAIFAAVIALCTLLIVLYAGDYAVLRIRIARHGVNSVLSTVTTFYAAHSTAAKSASSTISRKPSPACARSSLRSATPLAGTSAATPSKSSTKLNRAEFKI